MEPVLCAEIQRGRVKLQRVKREARVWKREEKNYFWYSAL